MTRRRLLALTDDLDDFVPHRVEVDAHRLQGLGGDALTLVEQPQQDVLGADVVVIQESRFFLGKYNYPSSSICEPLKHSCLLSLA